MENKLQDVIQHEQDLVNSRQNWMITFQGFLFTAFAFNSETIGRFGYVIATVGALLSLLTSLGVLAAYIAIDQARKAEAERVAQEDSEKEVKQFGGAGIAKWLGRINSMGVPSVLFIAWIVIMCLNRTA